VLWCPLHQHAAARRSPYTPNWKIRRVLRNVIDADPVVVALGGSMSAALLPNPLSAMLAFRLRFARGPKSQLSLKYPSASRSAGRDDMFSERARARTRSTNNCPLASLGDMGAQSASPATAD